MIKGYFLNSIVCVALCACSPSVYTQTLKSTQSIAITKDISPLPSIEKTIAPYRKDLEEKMNVKIASTPIHLSKTGQNSHLGNLLADFTFEAGKDWLMKNNIPAQDIGAVINIGGIRSHINKGDILVKHIYEVMPFENELVVVKMKGKDVKALFRYFERTQKNDPVSNIYIETMDKKLIRGLINGKEITPEQEYFIATSDYLALGGDDMAFFQKGEILQTGIKLRNIFLDKMKERDVLSFGEIEQRLQFHHTSKP